jgi:hypothetical protein
MLQKLTLNSYFSIGSEITISTLWKDSKDGRSALLALGKTAKKHSKWTPASLGAAPDKSGSCAANSARVNVEIRDPRESVSGCRQASGAKGSKESWGH